MKSNPSFKLVGKAIGLGVVTFFIMFIALNVAIKYLPTLIAIGDKAMDYIWHIVSMNYEQSSFAAISIFIAYMVMAEYYTSQIAKKEEPNDRQQ